MNKDSDCKKNLCINCGKMGHENKYCNEAITSFGVINVKILDNHNESLLLKNSFSIKKNKLFLIESKKYKNTKCYMSNTIKLYDEPLKCYEQHIDFDYNKNYKINNENIPFEMDIKLQKFCFYKNRILFMMVSRRFSLGFIEFIRGKYNISDATSIINLFEQMTINEIKIIETNTYDDILYYFLNRKNESKEIVLNRIYEGKYSNEYCEAKIKFNYLLNPNENEEDNIPWNLYFYTKHIKPKWNIPEWGFPKGRRDKRNEENLMCACREFEEETGYKTNEYIILNRIEPIEEKLIGTNGVNYKHIYYLAINNTDKEINVNGYDIYEIGNIKWFTYDEAISYIRPYHIDKKKILTSVYLFIMNYLIHYNQEI